MPTTGNRQAAAADRFYVAGGTMPPDSPSYVERRADRDLYESLQRGEFCYVLTSRQMGKSSLMVRTAVRLRAEGVVVAVLDLTVIGQNLTTEQWYSGLLVALGEQLGLEEELWEFWCTHEHLGPLQRWMAALKEVVLQAPSSRLHVTTPGAWSLELGADAKRRIVLFLDEIDAVRSLPFPTDEFFAAIRACYNRRAEEPEFQRLTFCLLGVATPADLIQDTRATPFNIGRRIELNDLTEADAAPLAVGLLTRAVGRPSAPAHPRPAARATGPSGREGPPASPRSGEGSWNEDRKTTPPPRFGEGVGGRGHPILRRILHWTGGHPYLTQRLCQAVAASGNVTSFSAVDELCETLFLSAAAREQDDNLLFVRERLLRNGVDLAGLLDLYRQVRRGRPVFADETDPRVDLLLLSGIVRRAGGCLQVRNRIYARVFDRAWIAANMPGAELRRQQAAYRAGLVRAASAAGVVVAIVLGLAFAAVQQARSANRNARRAVAAERAATAQLWESYLAQARALRWSGRPGRRFDSLAAVTRATAIRPSLELRNEAIASMALVDLRLVRQRAIPPDNSGVVFDTTLDRYAVGDRQGNVRVYRSEDGRELWSGRGTRDWSYPVSFSRDGRFLAGKCTLDHEEDLVVWDLLRGTVLIRERNGTHASAVSFSPDGRTLASARRDGSIRYYDLKTGREAARFPPGIHVDGLRFDPSGRHLAVSSLKVPGVQIRDVETFAIRRNLSSPTTIRRTAWRSDGTVLAGAGDDWRIYVWDLKSSREPAFVLQGHHGEVVDVEFRGDGDLLVSSSWDDTVRLWDLVTRSQVTSCAGILARFARDGRHLGVLGTDSQVQFWELAGGRECRTLRHPVAGKGPYDLDLSPDGRILASSAEDGVRLWDLSRAKQIASLLGEYTMTARFSPATGELISSGAKGLRRRAIRLPEPGAPKTGSKVAIGPPETVFPRPAGRAAVSQDGRTVAVVPKDGEEPSILRVFHRGNPGSETRLLAPPAFRHYVAVSPDGRWVAAGTWQGAGQATGVRVWEARSGRLLREFRLGSNVNVAFSPDGRWLATMTGQEYRLWRTGSWQPGPAFPREVAERNPGALVFSPDGTAIAIAHSPRVVQLIDIATGREFARLEAPNVQRSMPFCFSRDGTLLVTQGNPELIQVWDLRLIRDQLRSMGLGWRP